MVAVIVAGAVAVSGWEALERKLADADPYYTAAKCSRLPPPWPRIAVDGIWTGDVSGGLSGLCSFR